MALAFSGAADVEALAVEPPDAPFDVLPTAPTANSSPVTAPAPSRTAVSATSISWRLRGPPASEERSTRSPVVWPLLSDGRSNMRIDMGAPLAWVWAHH